MKFGQTLVLSVVGVLGVYAQDEVSDMFILLAVIVRSN
jgi:hypothetical protein